MSEHTDNPGAEAPEPGGWLAGHQRANCRGSSALDTYQGVLSDEIVLPQVAADDADPLQLVLATEAFADALLNQACFIPGEFAPEALWSFRVYEYWSQVRAGGHEQYFANRGRDEIALRCCRAGLKSMLADPHLEIFDLLVSLKQADARAAGKLAAQAGYKSVATALRDLDRRFAELEDKEPLTPRHKMWLKSLRKVKLVPLEEMDQHLNRIASANRLWRQRKQETEFLRAVAERDDPVHRAAHELCETAGLRFAGVRAGGFTPLRAVWPEGPKLNAYACRVETERGPRTALFYVEGGMFNRRRVACLIEQGSPEPLASISMAPAQYADIVPDHRKLPKVRD
jgi:hypothetical protein